MADKTPGSTKNSWDGSANVNMTVCGRADATNLNSVEIAILPRGKRQVSVRRRLAFPAVSDARAASTAISVGDPSSEYSEQSINEPASGSPRKQRRAVELAITMGKCLERVSTTRTASGSASNIASVNARVALLAKRTKSGDVAIQWSSGDLTRDPRVKLYPLHISSAYPQAALYGIPRCH